MKGVEVILHGGRKLAIIFRSYIQINGVSFLTDPDNFFQVGLHVRDSGVRLAPHVHKMTGAIQVTTIQEMLFIQSGKIRLTFFTTDGRKLSKKILGAGDSVLLMDVGHAVEFLAKTRMFEIKQGPYPGAKNAKIYFS